MTIEEIVQTGQKRRGAPAKDRDAEVRAMAKMFCVFTVIQRPKQQEDYWLNVGAVVAHDDGRGLNLLLQALPLHSEGKLVMMAVERRGGGRRRRAGVTGSRRVALSDAKPGGAALF